MSVCSFFSLKEHNLSWWQKEKQGNMSVQICAEGKSGCETFWFTRSDRSIRRPIQLCNQSLLFMERSECWQERTNIQNIPVSSLINVFICCIVKK